MKLKKDVYTKRFSKWINEIKNNYDEWGKDLPHLDYVDCFHYLLCNKKNFTYRKKRFLSHSEFNEFNECFGNNYYYLKSLDDDERGKYHYYEGLCLSKSLGLTNHGFLVKDNVVYDLTWRDGKVYTGVEIPFEFMESMVEESGRVGGIFRMYDYEKCFNEIGRDGLGFNEWMYKYFTLYTNVKVGYSDELETIQKKIIGEWIRKVEKLRGSISKQIRLNISMGNNVKIL